MHLSKELLFNYSHINHSISIKLILNFINPYFQNSMVYIDIFKILYIQKRSYHANHIQ